LDLKNFDYDLPEGLIAQEPLTDRSDSKLMVVDRHQKTITHKNFRDLTEYLKKNDCLVANDTMVISARLFGQKPTGALVELFLLKEIEKDVWETLCRPAKRLKVGATVDLVSGITATVVKVLNEGRRLVRFEPEGLLRKNLSDIGQIPLPPYITVPLSDKHRYQTIYADKEGSVAAPTAGLHFTDEVIDDIEKKGIKHTFVTLDVGLDTFRPVSTERIEDHRMHSENFDMPKETADLINETKIEGNRVVAVGTTTVRVIETVATNEKRVAFGGGSTEMFIYPGYEFKIVDAILTNFHLPRSTLLMMVSAFAGYELMIEAYQEAIRENYRFYSFGDAMLIV